MSQKRISAIEHDPESPRFGDVVRWLDFLGYGLELREKADWQAPSSVTGSNLYLLPHVTLPLFKIGKANGVEERAYSIGGIALDRAVRLAVPNERAAHHAERVLHRMFKSYRLTAYEAAAMGVGESGCGEWFKGECLDRVIAFVTANTDLLNATLVART